MLTLIAITKTTTHATRELAESFADAVARQVDALSVRVAERAGVWTTTAVMQSSYATRMAKQGRTLRFAPDAHQWVEIPHYLAADFGIPVEMFAEAEAV